MSILMKAVRISGFRGLENIEVILERATILTGMNNTGKTSFLKAIQLALGNTQFVSQDDFYIKKNSVVKKIMIDLKIIPIDENDDQCEDFAENWEILLTTGRIRYNESNQAFVPLRTVITFDEIKNNFRTQRYILQDWPEFKEDDVFWSDVENGSKTTFHFDEIPFFYMDAQRDILEDTKFRNSYLGKMLSKIEYSDEDIKTIEEQIKELNEKAVSSSDILSNLKTTLKDLDTAMDTSSEGIEITPFTKKIRDLNKGLTIYYTDNQDSFSMEYHGMGTRSWSSLLTIKAYIALLSKNTEREESVFHPITAIEEPEAHLHPNAQKKLYRQIDSIVGQKIISTHSPYIAAGAGLKQIRNFYKNENVTCGRIFIDKLTGEDVRKINRQVINTRGEIFFSKVIIFFEGETEEQALPIFAESYFNQTPVELGLDFVGVGGFGNYLPFLNFVESLKIPWLILSDAEASVVESVKEQFSKSGSDKNIENCIVFLDNDKNFESQLLDDGFENEIKKAVIEAGTYANDKHKDAKSKEIQGNDVDELYEMITGQKAQYGPIIAEEIIKSDKGLPPKIFDLFELAKSLLKGGGED